MKPANNYFHFLLFLLVLNFPNEVSAQCEISDITVETFECSGDFFYGEINFEYSGDVGEFFTYSISGQQDGEYPYDQLPMGLDFINVADLEFFSITITDDTGSGCSSASEFENPCFENCFISNLTAIPGECNNDDEFELVIDFEHEYTSDFFDLHINYSNGVVIENISYSDIPYTVTGLVEECISDIDVAVYDSEDDGCFTVVGIDPVCCSYDLCDLTNLTFDVTNCDGTEFQASVDFDFVGTSNEFNYTVYNSAGNEVELGSYLYANLPMNLFFDNTNSSYYTIVIKDQDDNTCVINDNFENPCYQDCLIYNLTAIPYDCVDGEFTLVVDFEHEFTSGFFDLHITYPFGLVISDIAYSSLPYTVTGLQEDCMSDIEVLVCDSEDGGCLDVIAIEPVCCANFCVFSNMVIEVSECDGGEYSVDIDFDYTGNAVEFDYILYDYQSNQVQSGSYAYANLPLTLGIDNTTSIGHYIVISDQEDQNCVIDEYFDNPCYEQGTDCIITSIDFDENPVCDDGLIVAEWFIFSENTSEVGFDVFIDEEFQFFIAYESDGLYSFDLEAPNTGSPLDEVFVLMICDNENADCCVSIDVENPCYEEESECELSGLVIENTECDNGEFTLIMDFDYSGTTNDFYDYIVYGAQNEIIAEGFAPFAELPLTININNTESQYFYVEINENDNMNCGIIGEFFNPCFGSNCNISSIDFGENPFCEEGLIITEWFIFSENISEVGYDIFINGEFITFVQYNNEGPYIFDIEAPNTSNFSITACDNENEDCCYTWELDNPCWDNESCVISNVVATPGECNDADEFTVTVNFEYENTGDQFMVNGNGMNYGLFNYSDLPITLDGFSADCQTIYEFIIHDVNENDCTNFGGAGPICCEDDQCQMTTLDFGPNPVCENGLIITEWLIDGENTSGVGYDIFINGEFELFVEYEQDNWYDFDIVAPETQFFLMTVCDNDNADCCIDWELENPCYEGETECEISNLILDATECFGSEFTLIIDFDYSGTTNEFYDYIIYNQVNEIIAQGFEPFAQLPFSIGIVNTESEYFVVSIFENDNDGCFVTGEFANPCFEESEECQITTLDFGENPICENGLIITEWLIDGENVSGVGYDIFINGVFELFVEYEEDSWYDFDMEAPDTEFFSISVCDNDNADCCIDWEVENPCFEPPVGDCWIDEFSATVTACEGNVFDVQIDFEYDDTSDQFIVNGNGNSYGTFSYADLPIMLTGLEADCTTDFEFVIHDLNDNDCTAGMEYGTVCCEDFNNIQQININNTIDESNININVNVIISLLSGCEIEVFIDGEYYTLLTEESTNFIIGPFDCESNQIIGLTFLNKCTNENTEFEIDLSEIDCTTNIEDTDLSKMLKWNQVNKILFVENDIQEEIEIQILSTDGRLVASNSVNQSELRIKLDHIMTGIYIVRIIDRKLNKLGLKKIFVH